MTINDFNDRGRAYVPEEEFVSFLYSQYGFQEGDYTKECNNNLYFCNYAGCELAVYNRTEGYGQQL